MKTISTWDDLKAYGIDPFTGEACGLGYRILCDLTANGKKILEKCLGMPALTLFESWNRGTEQEPHVGCVMRALEFFVPLAVFALLESGCTEVWLYKNQTLFGVEPSDPPERVDLSAKMCPEALARKFSYRGTAGDRNVHVMSSRIQ